MIRIIACLILANVSSGCSYHEDPITSRASALALEHHGEPYTWRTGGTLHAASALDWQRASYQNKRATVGDFISALVEQDQLTKTDLTPDEIKLMSETMTEIINAKFRMAGTSNQNEETYRAKKVSMAVLETVSDAGWLKEDQS